MENIGSIELYDQKSIFAISFAVLMLSVVFNFLYVYRMIRYILLAVMLLIIIIKRNTFIELLKNVKKK